MCEATQNSGINFLRSSRLFAFRVGHGKIFFEDFYCNILLLTYRKFCYNMESRELNPQLMLI